MSASAKAASAHGSRLPMKPAPLSMRRLDYRRQGSPVQIAERVRGEFVEMRGFSPTIEQAARLFHLSPEECQRILGSLVQEGFLRRTADGRYRLPAS
jgi:hypothetical protein